MGRAALLDRPNTHRRGFSTEEACRGSKILEGGPYPHPRSDFVEAYIVKPGEPDETLVLPRITLKIISGIPNMLDEGFGSTRIIFG